MERQLAKAKQIFAGNPQVFRPAKMLEAFAVKHNLVVFI